MGLFTTVYLRNGPTIDLMKRFHSFTDTLIDDGCCNFHDTGNQDNHGLTNDSTACIPMVSRKSHNATVGGRHLQDSQRIKIQNGRDIPLQAA
mgnify:CR=1 FL=1